MCYRSAISPNYSSSNKHDMPLVMLGGDAAVSGTYLPFQGMRALLGHLAPTVPFLCGVFSVSYPHILVHTLAISH